MNHNPLKRKHLPLTVKLGPGRHHDAGQRGLLLCVSDNGAKHWQLRFEMDGREHWLGLGRHEDIGLDGARERARQARLMVLDGINPIKAKKGAKAARPLETARSMTFEQAAKKFHEKNEGRWKIEKSRKAWLSGMERLVFPTIGKISVAAVDMALVRLAKGRFPATAAATHRECS